MATIRLLGTGTSNGIPMIGCDCPVCRSGDPKDKRLRCSALITSDQKDRILIDCGPDFRQQALLYQVHHLDAVLITHAHFDHIGGIDELRQINYLMKDSIDIYGTGNHIDEIRGRVSYLFRETQKGGGKALIDLHTFTPDLPLIIHHTPVLPFAIRHGNLDISGYRMGGLVYITDASAIPDSSLASIIQPRPQILILNALRHRAHSTHFSLEEAIDIAQQINAEQTWFIHMTHDILHAQVEAELPDNIHLAYDGLQLSFDS